MFDRRERREKATDSLVLPQRFDARSVDSVSVVDCINDIYSRANLVVSPLASIGVPVNTKSRFWDLENTNVLRSYSHGHFGLATGPRDLIGIRKYFSGYVRLIYPDVTLAPKPGDILITDFRQIGAFEVRHLDSLTVVLPCDLLDLDLTGLALPRIVEPGSIEYRLLSSAMESWEEELSRLRSGDAPLLEAAILGFIRGVLQHGAQSADRGIEASEARG